MYKPADIDNVTFKGSFMGGYNQEQVDNFLLSLSKDYEKLYNENEDLKKKLTILAQKVEEYRTQETNIKNAVLYSQRIRDEATVEAEAKSKEIIEAAEKVSKDLIDDVEEKAAKQREEEEKRLADFKAQNEKEIEKEKKALDQIKKEVSDFKLKLQELYKEHLKTILSLPTYEEPKEEEKIFDEKPEESKGVILEPIENEQVAEETEEVEDNSNENEEAEQEEAVEEKTTEAYIDKEKVRRALDLQDTIETEQVKIDFNIKD
ncbi:MAG: DivIVA domain-containing protein [Ruminococcaceae bacterium]|nr:DivIVA domain-containing protein [Oscillospiraceae bacterium]